MLSWSSGMLYAVGGCDENNLRLHTMERYNPTTDTWSFVPPMSTCRSSPCVIGDKYLYVIGGVSYVGIALNTGEKFDPHTNTWTKLPPMSTKRASACGAVVNGKIYVIGRFGSIIIWHLCYFLFSIIQYTTFLVRISNYQKWQEHSLKNVSRMPQFYA